MTRQFGLGSCDQPAHRELPEPKSAPTFPTVGSTKEGILLRNVNASLVLSDHFPGGGILELGNRSGKE